MAAPLASLQTLALLAVVVGVVATLGATVILAMMRRGRLARRALGTAGVLTVGYLGTLFAVGATSDEHLLPAGGAKAFCEVDCHVVYSVTAVTRETDTRETDTVAVTVREAYDGATRGAREDSAAVRPGTRRFALVDTDGRRWPAYGHQSLGGDTLFAPLRPGEFRAAAVLFVVPDSVTPRALLVEDDSPVSRLLVGHERSPLHRKTLLSLPAGSAAISAR